MAKNTAQTEEDDDKDQTTSEETSTEDKASEIGKKIDVATGKEEKIPDYDVTEEGAEKDEKVDDEKLAKDKRAEDTRQERKELTNREKRQLKKKRIAEKFDAKDALIRQQQEQLNAMTLRLNEVDGRLSSYDQAQFTQVWNSTVEAYQAAERKHAEAFSAGDGAAATAAMKEMYIAQKRIDDMEIIKARASTQQPQRQQQAPDPRIVNKAQEWAKRNEWFKVGGTDDDSAIADAIAVKLVKEGYDPKTDDYYDELDERLEKRGIGRRQDDDDDDEPVQRRERKSPPVGGSGTGRGDIGNGKMSMTPPPAFINTLKDNGYWDDVPKRNRMIAGYLKGVKERGNT